MAPGPWNEERHLPSSEVVAALERLSQLGGELSDEVLEQESRALIAQVARGELNILVVGQFKRGKSSVVNALLEEDLMPTGALPLTGVATAIRYGSPSSITVEVRGGERRSVSDGELASLISERTNPKNVRGVVSVDVVRPVAALRGFSLFDTPGVGSTLYHNTTAARAILPRADAAILVVGPEPPIGAEELAYAADVARSSMRLFVLFNKSDLAGTALDELLGFTASALAQAGVVTDIFPLSATRAREVQRNERIDADFERFVASLRSFVDERGSETLDASTQRRATSLANRARALLHLRAQAIALPENRRKQCRELLEAALVKIDDRVRLLELAVDDDVKRLRLRLEDMLDRRYDEERTSFAPLVESIAHTSSASRRREALEAAIAERAHRWRQAAVEQAESEMRSHAATYERSLNEIEQAVIQAGCEALHVGVEAFAPRAIAFAPASLTLPVSIYPTTGLELARDWAISLLPRGVRERALRSRVASTLESETDALRGKLRYGIAHDLEPWRRSVRETIRGTLSATRSAVLAAFPSEARSAEETGAREMLERSVAQLAEIDEGLGVAR